MIIFEDFLPLDAEWFPTGEVKNFGAGTIEFSKFGFSAFITDVHIYIPISPEVDITCNQFSSCEVSAFRKHGRAWDENHNMIWKPTEDNEVIWRVTKLNI